MRYAHGRYLLFGFNKWYPEGGLNDLINSFDLMKDVKTAIKENALNMTYFHVFDTETKKILTLDGKGKKYK
jgi:hypothetical protein